MEFLVQDIAQLDVVAQDFVRHFLTINDKTFKHTKFAFSGEMGIGKTTFILKILKLLGVKDALGSPTYSLVNEYRLKHEKSKTEFKIYHFDLYRIENETEAYNAGIVEMLYDKAICFVEWPENAKNILSNEFLWVNLTKNELGFRVINVNV